MLIFNTLCQRERMIEPDNVVNMLFFANTTLIEYTLAENTTNFFSPELYIIYLLIFTIQTG